MPIHADIGTEEHHKPSTTEMSPTQTAGLPQITVTVRNGSLPLTTVIAVAVGAGGGLFLVLLLLITAVSVGSWYHRKRRRVRFLRAGIRWHALVTTDVVLP